MQLAYPQNDTRAETLRYLGAGGWQPDAASQVLLQKAEDALRAAAVDERMAVFGQQASEFLRRVKICAVKRGA